MEVEWIELNRMYNNRTCGKPHEHWQQCNGHNCIVAELYGRTLLECVADVPNEILEKIKDGAMILWAEVWSLIQMALPYILIGAGVVLLAPLLWGLIKCRTEKLCRRGRREKAVPLTREELKLLLQEERLTSF